MGLKLRATVTHVATSDGALLRMGECTLAVRGASVYGSFRQLSRCLDGRWTQEQLCSAVSAAVRPAVARLLDSLIETGMVYTPDDRDGDPDRALAPDATSYIARIESTNSRAAAVFRDLVGSAVRASGPSWMTAAVLDACHELGITRVGVTSGDEESCDLFVVAGDANASRAWLKDADGSRSPSAPRVPLIVHGGKVLAGPFVGPDGAACAACLIDSYASSTPTRADTRRIESAVGLGARILVQRWLDLESRIAPDAEAMLLYEVDIDTLEVTQHAAPPRATCGRCGSARASRRRHTSTAQLRDSPEPSIDDVLARAHRYLTDPATGLLASIGEGALLQLPHKQSIVEWHRPHDRRRLWTTEGADDVRTARLAAVRTALEQYLLEFVDGECQLLQARPADPIAPGLVVSGGSQAELQARAVLGALTVVAQDRGVWKEQSFRAGIGGRRAELTWAYLEDIGQASRVTIERDEALSGETCHVLRFAHDATPVSIVAGESEPQVWAAGLQDIWLHVTGAIDACRPETRSPAVRLRHVMAPEALERAAPPAWSARLGLQVELTSVALPVLRVVQPLVFAHVSVHLVPDATLANGRLLETRRVTAPCLSNTTSTIVVPTPHSRAATR